MAHAYLFAHIAPDAWGHPLMAGFVVLSDSHPTTIDGSEYALMTSQRGDTFADARDNVIRYIGFRAEREPMWRHIRAHVLGENVVGAAR